MLDVLLIPLAALAVPVVIVPVALALRYARYERELEHAERMKALELGRTLPQDESWWSPARLSLAIGVVVPIVALVCAWVANWNGLPEQEETRWTAAGVVALAGVISGSYLIHRHLLGRERSGQEALAKPAWDAEAYEGVGQRG